MSDKKAAKKKPKWKLLFGKRGYTLTIVLAVLIVVVSIISISYSWYSPGSREGTSMNYGMNIKVRSENCKINGTRESADNANPMAEKTGELDFTQSEAVNSATLSLKTGDTEQIYYFETTIKNLDEQPTNVSLYLKSIPNTKFGLGVASPSNSYHVFNAAQQDVCIVRNAFIRGSADEKYHDLKVVWFIRAANSVTIDFKNLYLRYN